MDCTIARSAGFGLVPIGSTQAEHDEQCGVHAPLLFGCQMTGQIPQPPYVRGDSFARRLPHDL